MGGSRRPARGSGPRVEERPRARLEPGRRDAGVRDAGCAGCSTRAAAGRRGRPSLRSRLAIARDLWAVVPVAVHRARPDRGRARRETAAARASRTGSARTRSGATCTRASSTARSTRCRARSSRSRSGSWRARFIGVLAAAVGGVVDDVLMRLVDVLLVDPRAAARAVDHHPAGVRHRERRHRGRRRSVAVFARLARSEVVRVRRTDYVEAAFGSGGTLSPCCGATCCRTR